MVVDRWDAGQYCSTIVLTAVFPWNFWLWSQALFHGYGGYFGNAYRGRGHSKGVRDR